MGASVRRIPNFIRARSANALRALMLKVNLRDSVQYKFTIMHANGFFYAWYERDVPLQVVNEELVKGNAG